MKDMTTNEERFINMVSRINFYLIIMGIILLIYFLCRTKVDIFLFLLSLMNMLFALLSYKHVVITNRLAIELGRAKGALRDVTEETRKMHPDIK